MKQLAERGRLDKLPPAIRDMPELRMGLELFYGAFWDLSTCRPIGMGEGPIPWTAVDAYATARRFDDEQRDDLHHHVRAMDRAYLKHRNEQAEKESKRGREKSQGAFRSKGRSQRPRS